MVAGFKSVADVLNTYEKRGFANALEELDIWSQNFGATEDAFFAVQAEAVARSFENMVSAFDGNEPAARLKLWQEQAAVMRKAAADIYMLALRLEQTTAEDDEEAETIGSFPTPTEMAASEMAQRDLEPAPVGYDITMPISCLEDPAISNIFETSKGDQGQTRYTCHSYGLDKKPAFTVARAVGMVGTFVIVFHDGATDDEFITGGYLPLMIRVAALIYYCA